MASLVHGIIDICHHCCMASCISGLIDMALSDMASSIWLHHIVPKRSLSRPSLTKRQKAFLFASTYIYIWTWTTSNFNFVFKSDMTRQTNKELILSFIVIIFSSHYSAYLDTSQSLLNLSPEGNGIAWSIFCQSRFFHLSFAFQNFILTICFCKWLGWQK